MARTAAHPHRIAFGAAPRLARRATVRSAAPIGARTRSRRPAAARPAQRIERLRRARRRSKRPARMRSRRCAASARFARCRTGCSRSASAMASTWIDDSIATTPQATLEALASLAAARSRCSSAVTSAGSTGAVRRSGARAIRRTRSSRWARTARVSRACCANAPAHYRLHPATTLAEAVAARAGSRRQDGVILLSPGAPSFDQFRDYAERGRAFAALGRLRSATLHRRDRKDSASPDRLASICRASIRCGSGVSCEHGVACGFAVDEMNREMPSRLRCDAVSSVSSRGLD